MEDVDKKPYHCNICGKDFSLSLTFKAHTVLHKREAPYKCGWCGQVFIRNSLALKNHMRWHLDAESGDEQSSPESQVTCKHCDKKFSTKTSLKKHLLTHEAPQKTFECGVCKKVYRKVESLKSHMQQRHSSEKPSFVCEVCKEAFECKTGLDRHFRKHKDELKYICDICMKVFRSKKILGNHKKSKHCDGAGDTSFENICAVSSFRDYMNPIEDLTGSVVDRGTLEGLEGDVLEKQFMCSSCGKILPSQKSVLNHMLMHAETSLYSCKVCGSVFSNKSHFDKHTQKHGNYCDTEGSTKVLCEAIESQEKITLYIKDDMLPNKMNNNKRKLFMLEDREIPSDQPALVSDQPALDISKKRRQVERDRKDDVMVINEDVVIEVEEVIIAEKDDSSLEENVIIDPVL